MPRYSAISRSRCMLMKPSSCWTMARQAITADCLPASGYLATSRAKRSRIAGFRGAEGAEGAVSWWVEEVVIRSFSPVDFAEHDVHRADHRDSVGDHVAARHFVEGGKVREAGGPDLQAVRLVGAVAHQIDAELALWVLDGGIRLAFRHVEAFGEELEMVDQLLHVRLHRFARRRCDLVVAGDHRAGVDAQPGRALLDDLVGLAHFFHAHEVAVVAVAGLADRSSEEHTSG